MVAQQQTLETKCRQIKKNVRTSSKTPEEIAEAELGMKTKEELHRRERRAHREAHKHKKKEKKEKMKAESKRQKERDQKNRKEEEEKKKKEEDEKRRKEEEEKRSREEKENKKKKEEEHKKREEEEERKKKNEEERKKRKGVSVGIIEQVPVIMPSTEPSSLITPASSSANSGSSTGKASSTSEPEDGLIVALQELIALSPSADENESPVADISAEIKGKWEECLGLYAEGLPVLAQDPEKLKQLEVILDDLAAPSNRLSFSSSEQRFLSALSLQLSSFISRQRTLLVESNTLDIHFLSISSYKAKATELSGPLKDLFKQRDVLIEQESALRQWVDHLEKRTCCSETKLGQHHRTPQHHSNSVQGQGRRKGGVVL